MFGEKMYLKDQMDRSWLIQRLEKPFGAANAFSLAATGLSNEALKVLDQVFSFDYMGSSEFEFGAIPTALQFILEEARKKDLISGEHNGVYYVCPKSYEESVKQVISKLLEDEWSMHLLERCGLKEAKNDPKSPHNRAVGWFEINNGFFFFVDKEMFENTKALFNVE